MKRVLTSFGRGLYGTPRSGPMGAIGRGPAVDGGGKAGGLLAAGVRVPSPGPARPGSGPAPSGAPCRAAPANGPFQQAMRRYANPFRSISARPLPWCMTPGQRPSRPLDGKAIQVFRATHRHALQGGQSRRRRLVQIMPKTPCTAASVAIKMNGRNCPELSPGVPAPLEANV